MLNLNHIVIVGTLIEEPILKEDSNGFHYASILLKVDRPYKNSNGIFESDEIYITLWKGISEMVSEHCKIGDIIVVKGRLQTLQSNKKSKDNHYYEVIAEHVTFQNFSKISIC